MIIKNYRLTPMSEYPTLTASRQTVWTLDEVSPVPSASFLGLHGNSPSNLRFPRTGLDCMTTSPRFLRTGLDCSPARSEYLSTVPDRNFPSSTGGISVLTPYPAPSDTKISKKPPAPVKSHLRVECLPGSRTRQGVERQDAKPLSPAWRK